MTEIMSSDKPGEELDLLEEIEKEMRLSATKLLVGLVADKRSYIQSVAEAEHWHLLKKVKFCMNAATEVFPELGPIADELDEALDRYNKAEAVSLDKAFSIERPKGWTQSRKKYEINILPRIELRVDQLRSSMSIADVFEEVGNLFNRAASTVKTDYYKRKKQLTPKRLSWAKEMHEAYTDAMSTLPEYTDNNLHAHDRIMRLLNRNDDMPTAREYMIDHASDVLNDVDFQIFKIFLDGKEVRGELGDID